MIECCIPSLGHCDLDLVSYIGVNFSAYLLYSLRQEFRNLVCGCILEWRCVTYHFRVAVALTSDLVFRLIMSGAYLLYFLSKESQIRCVDAFWDNGDSSTILLSL